MHVYLCFKPGYQNAKKEVSMPLFLNCNGGDLSTCCLESRLLSLADPNEGAGPYDLKGQIYC